MNSNNRTIDKVDPNEYNVWLETLPIHNCKECGIETIFDICNDCEIGMVKFPTLKSAVETLMGLTIYIGDFDRLNFTAIYVNEGSTYLGYLILENGKIRVENDGEPTLKLLSLSLELPNILKKVG